MTVRKKKTERQKLKKKLEGLVKKFVKIRDNYTCQYSGEKVEGTNCHASHVIPVSRDGRLAFDPLNMKVLSYHNHINGWHKHPTEFGVWFREKFPDRMKYLEEKYLQNQKKGGIEIKWLESEIDKYTKLLKDLDEVNDVTINDLQFL